MIIDGKTTGAGVPQTTREGEAAPSWGAKVEGEATTFRLWAPAEPRVDLLLDGERVAMARDPDGWFTASVSFAATGRPYLFRLADGTTVPDPASRRQQSDLEGPSLVTDPAAYRWRNGEWTGRDWEEAVVYELHVGTATGAGTFAAAAGLLPHLAAMGFTAVELMPVAHFHGTRGWGYDGVLHYAPHGAYGPPDALKAFVDAAHGHGLMVLLDVVYNHFGPVGNHIGRYAPGFFRQDDHTPWGMRIAFEMPAVRRYFIDNVLYWLREFRFDGLRFDAVDEIVDTSDPPILEEIAHAVAGLRDGRKIHLVTENPANDPGLIAARGNGMRLYRADWNDAFHHALHIGLTGEVGAHYAEFAGDPWGTVRRTLAQGYPSGVGRDLPPTAFVHFLQNHDQVGNRALGDRLHASLPARLHAVATELLLLSPQIPLFFMGDDHLSSRPFHYFVDDEGARQPEIHRHRIREARNFGDLPEDLTKIPDPTRRETFLRSRLNWPEKEEAGKRAWAAWLCDLIRVRREKIVPLLKQADRHHGRVVAGRQADGVVFVDWRLGAHVLEMRANLSSMPAAPEGGEGALIHHSAGTAQEGPLEPWSLRLHLR